MDYETYLEKHTDLINLMGRSESEKIQLALYYQNQEILMGLNGLSRAIEHILNFGSILPKSGNTYGDERGIRKDNK